jgi:hypothetical protein
MTGTALRFLAVYIAGRRRVPCQSLFCARRVLVWPLKLICAMFNAIRPNRESVSPQRCDKPLTSRLLRRAS